MSVRRLALSLLALLSVLCSTPSCGVSAAVINNPKNKSLRFDLLKRGLSDFCEEMQRRGAPLKQSDGAPVVGRFFAQGCDHTIVDEGERQSVVVRFTGRGYTWLNTTGRLGFKTTGVLEYAADFRLHEGDIYAFFRPRKLDATQFEVTLVESALARGGAATLGVNPNALGKRVFDAHLNRGFTVIRDGRGNMDFIMGLLEPGQRPFKPFKVENSRKTTLANERTEVRSGQQDFIGAFEIGSGQALYLSMKLDGAPALDVFVVRREQAGPMLDAYATRAGATTLAAPPALDDVLVPGQLWQRKVPTPPGEYYLLLDNSAQAGRTSPTPRPGKVDYLIQVGGS